MVKPACPPSPETLVHFQKGVAYAFACSRSLRLSHASLQTHLSCAEAPLLRQQGRWTATLWASCQQCDRPLGADTGRCKEYGREKERRCGWLRC